MSLKNINNKLNKNVNEETAFINSLSLGKYFLMYIPILFLMFATAQFFAGVFFDFTFEWKSVLIQAIFFGIFFRIFHFVRNKWFAQWKNKHN